MGFILLTLGMSFAHHSRLQVAIPGLSDVAPLSFSKKSSELILPFHEVLRSPKKCFAVQYSALYFFLMEIGRGTAFEIVTIPPDWVIIVGSRGANIVFADSESFCCVL